MRTLAVLLYLLFSTIQFADAAIVQNNPGGVIDDFLAHYSRLSANREFVVISGYCYSACTLITHFIPRDRACVTPGTVFGFHSAYRELGQREIYAAESTRAMWKLYPWRVQKLIRSAGWDGQTKHPKLVKIPGISIYPSC